jgi:hypothetical protein
MRILLDESLPKDLKGLFVNHEAETVALAGWAGVKNGKLLALAATAYDVFLTADQNIEFQQNLSKLPVSSLVMVLVNNRIETIARLLPEVLVALDQVQPKTFTKVGGNLERHGLCVRYAIHLEAWVNLWMQRTFDPRRELREIGVRSKLRKWARTTFQNFSSLARRSA